MNRGRGNFTPRGRGRGGPRTSPSSGGSDDRRSHNSAGAEPSSSGERIWQRKETFSAGKQMSWERKSAPKQAQPATSDREFSSPVQSEEPDLSNNLHANSSASREKSWQRNERPSGQRHNTSWQGHTGWKQAQPVAYKATLPQSIVPEKGSSVDGPLNLDRSLMDNLESPIEKSCKDHESVGGSENLNKGDSSQDSECAVDVEPFDICPPPKAGVIKLNLSLIEMNKEKRKQKQSLEPKSILLRSGMVLLKNYISIPEQVEMVNECRKLGKGKGGFYQPGYRDGAKLNLKMMCLGKNWDPQTSSYGDIRPIDGVKPPPIPTNFFELVKRSIKESHTQISRESGFTGKGVEAILPWMSPDICLVNFYTTSGRLGLHQDRDERGSSLDKGSPVVSISIGDTAEFLYGDQSDVDKAEKVNLESGDVLIFGGKSRLVYHGVSSIKPNTAPKSLLDKTNLRAGRLNLTFREY